ncbi:MAG: hypothetical protein HY052_01160 [Proteobacteria bacterium]|nr:hypothetical protein [Pseudomonadota bacterium]
MTVFGQDPDHFFMMHQSLPIQNPVFFRQEVEKQAHFLPRDTFFAAFLNGTLSALLIILSNSLLSMRKSSAGLRCPAFIGTRPFCGQYPRSQ